MDEQIKRITKKLEVLEKAFSESARAAALEARRAKMKARLEQSPAKDKKVVSVPQKPAVSILARVKEALPTREQLASFYGVRSKLAERKARMWEENSKEYPEGSVEQIRALKLSINYINLAAIDAAKTDFVTQDSETS